MKKKNSQKINPIAAGVAGAVAGAGMAMAASAAMNDAKTRHKVEKVVSNVKKQAAAYVKQLDSNKNIKEGKKAVSRAIASTVKKSSSAVKMNSTKAKSKKAPAKRTAQA